MRLGCALFLTAALVVDARASFASPVADAVSCRVTEVPPLLRAKLLSTNAVAGVFTQTKTDPDGSAFVSRGTYRVRPGVDFAWRTTDPFDALFYADQASYVYSNEDECVTRPLRELRGHDAFADVATGDFSPFFAAFDALYKEEPAGVFHVLAKPKEKRLAEVLARVEADGTVTNWTLRATFPNRTTISVTFEDRP